MSTFAVEVVPVNLEPHPNADSLSIVKVYGYNVIVRTADWVGVERAAYIPPDSIVPATEQFAFLGTSKRIKVRKFRGLYSQGLLIPAPDGAELGDDVAEQLGVTHYEPPLRFDTRTGRSGEGDDEAGPSGHFPRYDVEHMRRYGHLFVPGEPVVATEKIHGANGRWTFKDGSSYCGSRNQWKKESEGNAWWRALRKYQALGEFLQNHEGLTAYGELYGAVQDLRYGHENGAVSIALFDIWCDGVLCARSGQAHWLNADNFRISCDTYDLPRVPVLYEGPFDPEALEAVTSGPTVLGNGAHVREGIVVRPAIERNDPEIGRVQLKLINNAYLEKAA